MVLYEIVYFSAGPLTGSFLKKSKKTVSNLVLIELMMTVVFCWRLFSHEEITFQ